MGILGDVDNNYSYVVVAKNNCGSTAVASNRVGEFDYGVEPGTP